MLSTAELIELENWITRVARRRLFLADRDEDKLDEAEWLKRYSDMPYLKRDRDRLFENLVTLLESAHAKS